MVHAFLHLLVPGVVALLFYRPRWRRAWLILAAALLTLGMLALDYWLAARYGDLSMRPGEPMMDMPGMQMPGHQM